MLLLLTKICAVVDVVGRYLAVVAVGGGQDLAVAAVGHDPCCCCFLLLAKILAVVDAVGRDLAFVAVVVVVVGQDPCYCC